MAAGIDMTNLRMHETVNRRAVDDHATAFACADGQVHEIRDVACGSPPMLGQSRRVGVGVEADGTAEFPGEASRDVGVAPSHLRGVADETVSRGGRTEFYRSK